MLDANSGELGFLEAREFLNDWTLIILKREGFDWGLIFLKRESFF